MSPTQIDSDEWMKIARGFAGVVATVALIVFMVAGYQENSMLARRLFVSPQLCVSDPKHFRVANMKIDRCVPNNVAERWDDAHNFVQGGAAVFAVAFGALFVSDCVRRRRAIIANGS